MDYSYWHLVEVVYIYIYLYLYYHYQEDHHQQHHPLLPLGPV